VLDLCTKVKVNEASEIDKLRVKQIVANFNIEMSQVYDITGTAPKPQRSKNNELNKIPFALQSNRKL
jgi:hypothetical protein